MNSRLVLGLVSVLALAWAGARADDAQPRRYAVISRIGDSLTLVRHEPEVGSHLDRNDHESLTLPDAGIDHMALLAVDKALKQADPSAQVTLLDSAPPAEGAAAAPLLDGSDQFVPGEALLAALRKTGATHLLLLSKYRSETLMKARHSHLGSGKLEGLGFYLDYTQKMRRADTGESGRGFIAPYAYYRVSLIDLATLKVVKHHEVRASNTVSVARSQDSFDPWEALSASQKLNMLLRFIRVETPPAVADVMQP